jgi:hypothetical protein
VQPDETTHISHCSQLLVFVRYVHADAIKKLIFCESLLEIIKTIDILKTVKSVIAKEILTGKLIFMPFAQIELLLVIRLVLLL